MKNFKTIFMLSAILLFGCKSEELELTKSDDTQTQNQTVSADAGNVTKGVIRVKLTQEVGNNLSISGQSGQLRSGQSGIDSYLQEIGAKSMTRVFPYAGKYEERTRREGLHLWYDITFDESQSVTRAASEARNIPGVDIVEELYQPALPPYKATVANFESTRAADNPFNDPRLTAQWHYNNTGATPKSIAGADVNLFKAWEKETGKPNVIVAIVDGGIDVKHEDIKDNMHVNLAELNGLPGVDDDGNGYIDDIYGYNFVTGKGLVTADDHGTHVGGTVAARNNNGIGVCGVAGGDGTPNSGIRLISCQMFSDKQSAGGAVPIKYGADNGAVISQNSWGYTYPGPGSLPASMKEAIDYFIKYAGCDNNGNQLPNSPMKGGVVFFAAGNDDKDYLSYPSAYSEVVSVSAMAPDWKKAWYTNRGDWVTIMAPGGDEYYPQGMVLSLLPNNKYGYMQGTSMACPHVSGIAALVVSKFGGQGFTNEDLKKRVTSALRPKDINASNPDYKGRLGKGYIDAEKALAVNENKVPGKVDAVSVKENYTSLELTWKAVSDADDGTASVYKLYYSNKETLNASNYKNGTLTNIGGMAYKAGEPVIYTLTNLPLNTAFSFAIVAEDRWGLQSAPTFFSGKTKENFPPKLTRTGAEKIRITGTETAEVKILVTEPDNQEWTYTTTGQNRGVTIIQEKEGLTLKFKALATIGAHKLTIRVADIFDAAATMEIPFEIYENHPPKLIKEFQKFFIPVNKNDYSINLAEYFTDEDGHAITYTARALDPSTAGVSLSGDKLTFNPARVGVVSVEVSATDSQEATTRKTFQLQVVKDELVYVMYPIPVSKILNVRLSDAVQNATLSIRNTTGTQVYKQEVTATTPEQRMLQLDLSKLSGGSYILHVDANGKSFKQSFIKL